MHRCDVFPGDFLQSVTPGHDAYFIKSALHDGDDEKFEPGKPVGHPHRLIDLETMVSVLPRFSEAQAWRISRSRPSPAASSPWSKRRAPE